MSRLPPALCPWPLGLKWHPHTKVVTDLVGANAKFQFNGDDVDTLMCRFSGFS